MAWFILIVASAGAMLSLAIANLVSRGQDVRRVNRLQAVVTNQRAIIDQGACFNRIEFEYEGASGNFFILIADAIAIGDSSALPPERLTDARRRLEVAESRLHDIARLCPDPKPVRET